LNYFPFYDEHIQLSTIFLSLLFKKGQLRGKVASTFRGLDYYSFQGIPYAKPPIAELRFK
ncbi:hypothetical protein L9F63_019848, partial [Diploptera punctata]